MKFIAAFIRWWNGEADAFKAPSTAPNGVPRDHFAKVRDHFDADGNYIFKDAGLARAAQTAKAVGATMTLGTVVQTIDETSVGVASGTSFSFGSSVTAGNTVILLLFQGANSGSANYYTVTSPLGTMTNIFEVDSGAYGPFAAFICSPAAPGTSITVTTNDGATYWPWACELSGAAVATLYGTGIYPPGTKSPTISQTTSAGQMAFAIVEGPYAGVTSPASPPWTNWSGNFDSFAYQMFATTTSWTTTWTSNSAQHYGVGSFYLTFYSAPSAPTLTAPANTATINALTSTTFSATYNSTDGENQNAFALEFAANGGAYTYWDVATQAFSSSIVWNPSNVAPGNSFSVVLPANALTNGDTYTWSMASQEAGANLQGPFAGAFSLTTQAPLPSAPTLTAPANASTVDVAPGVTFSATYNPNDGGTQTGYAFRIKTASGSYNYWNAGTSALQSTIVWNPISTAPGASWSLALPSGVLTDGNVYNWSFASEEAGAGQQGPFATDFTITGQAAPTISVSAPSGTTTDAYPVVSWTESFPSGASQIAYQVVIESGTFGLTPGSGTSVWNSGVVSSTAASIGEPVPLQSGVTYRVFVQVTETNSVASAWAYSTFTASFTPPATPTFTAVAGNDPVTGAPMATLTIQANDNELTANQASLETGAVTGWTGDSNTTLAASTTWAADGAYSLSMTAVTAGNVNANTPGGTSGVAVVPGVAYRAMATFHTPASAYTCGVTMSFYDATGTYISAASGTVAGSTTGGAQAFVTAVAPANAAYANLTVTVDTLPAAGVVYCDKMLLAPGTSSSWSPGGFVGASTVNFTFSDDNVNWFAVRNGTGVAIPANQQVSVIDYEGALGFTRHYQAQVVAP